MNKMANENWPVHQSKQTRKIPAAETEMGLWVDRFGYALGRGEPNQRLNLLGLYAVVTAVDGAGWFYSRVAGEFHLEEGDGALIFPDVPYVYGAADRVYWRHTKIMFAGSLVDHFRSLKLLRPKQPFFRDSEGAVQHAVESLYDYWPNDSAQAAQARFAILSNVLARLTAMQTRQDGTSEDNLARRVADYIRAHATDIVSVADLPPIFDVSYRQLRRVFSEQMGMSPKQYLTTTRINLARERLIANTTRPQREIAMELGFSDVYHFMRVFKQHTGRTPGQYRREEADSPSQWQGT